MATTTINDISDLARILEEHPEWAETLRSLLLSRAVWELPEKVAQQAVHLEQLTEQAAQQAVQLNRMTGEVRDFIRGTRQHNRRQDRQMEWFLGIMLERELHGIIAPLIAERFNLRRPVIVKSWVAQLEEPLYDALEAAEEAGRITTRQSFLVQQTDFILRGQRKDSRAGVYVAVEASRTVKERDITRARERADILATATGTEALAVVVGNFVAEPQERQAADWAVAIIQVAEPEEEAAEAEGV